MITSNFLFFNIGKTALAKYPAEVIQSVSYFKKSRR